MTPRKDTPLEKVLKFAHSNQMLTGALVIFFGVVFAPEIKQYITFKTGLTFSNEAKSATMIMQKLDAQKSALDSSGQIARTKRFAKWDSILTRLDTTCIALNDMLTYTPTGKQIHKEYKHLQEQRWEMRNQIGYLTQRNTAGNQ